MRTRIYLLFALLLLAVSAVTAQDDADLTDLLAAGSRQATLGDSLDTQDFNEETDWPTDGTDTQSFLLDDGAYHISVIGEGSAAMASPESYDDVVIQVSADQLSDQEGNAYGLACRTDSQNQGGYRFTITAMGSYAILKNTPEGLESLGVGGESDAIEPGQAVNELVIVCAGGYLAFYANGELLAEAQDDTYSEGHVGFVVSGVNAEIAFDDLSVWSASVAPAAGETSLSPSGEVVLVERGSDSETTLTEMESLGLIPSGSTFIFGEDYTFFSGAGAWFTPLASDTPRQNIVIGGELTFTPGVSDEEELCGLTARIERDANGDATTFLNVGLNNQGAVMLVDRASAAEDAVVETSADQVSLDEPHHIVILLLDDTADVYLDGVLVLDDVVVGERAGTYGLSLLASGEDAKCEGRSIWAYEVPPATPGVCVVSPDAAVNQRGGAGTDFEIVGQLAAGTQTVVTGQADDAGGQTWWQLEGGGWVRSDVVNLIGDCIDIPAAG